MISTYLVTKRWTPVRSVPPLISLKNIPFSTLFSAHTFLQRNRSLWVTTPTPSPRSLSSWKTIESDFTEKSGPINFPEPIKNRTRIVVKSGPNNLNRTRFHNNSSPITIWNRSDPTAAIRIRFKFVSEIKQSSPIYYSGPTGKYGTRYPRKRWMFTGFWVIECDDFQSDPNINSDPISFYRAR